MGELADLPYPTPSSPAATAVMRGNRRVDTRPEVAVRSGLHRRGLRFRKDCPIRVDGRLTRPDIAFTRMRVAVFIDGCFWHRCPAHGNTPKSNTDYWSAKLDRNAERDRAVSKALTGAGWRVIRAWEHEPTDEVVERITAALRETDDGCAVGSDDC